jgi:predicted transcriptional regulator YdeE/DNA-binding transcriptional MerR regulator
MFKIGDFSKLSRVPVKTLRYYDEIGLFKPRGINRYTRYRYYALEQLPELYRILSLKELGFSLEQINQLLSGELTSKQLLKMLKSRKDEIAGQIQQGQTQIAQVEARIQQMEREGQLPHREVVLKKEHAQWVASANGILIHYDGAEIVLEQLYNRLKEFLDAHGLSTPGPLTVIYPEDEASEEGQRIEAAMPISAAHRRGLPSSIGSVRVYQLPAEKNLATVVHQGSLATVGEAYRILIEWMQSMKYRQSGPAREVYLRFPDQNHPGQCFLEVQIPVCPIKQEYKIMEPKIINLDAFQVVGMRYFGKNEHNDIGELWDKFLPQLDKIQHLAPGPAVSYGVCTGGEVGEAFEYIAALPVSRLKDIPAGMVGKTLPAQTYVVMEARGLADIGSAYERILEEWLPGSGYRPAEGPDFEFYPEDMEPADPEAPIYIYYPIQKE